MIKNTFSDKKKPLNDILTFRHFDILYKPKNDEK